MADNAKARTLNSTVGASVGGAIGGIIGSVVAPGVGTAAAAKTGAFIGGSVALALTEIAEKKGYYGLTGVPHMLLDAGIAVVEFLSPSENQPTNSNLHSKVAELMPSVEQAVTVGMNLYEESSKKQESSHATMAALMPRGVAGVAAFSEENSKTQENSKKQESSKLQESSKMVDEEDIDQGSSFRFGAS